MDRSFLQERIEKTKEQIIAYEDAITAIVSKGAQQYSLDTGQTRQTVTKLDLGMLQDKLDALYNRLCILEQRLTGGSSVTVRPAW